MNSIAIFVGLKPHAPSGKTDNGKGKEQTTAGSFGFAQDRLFDSLRSLRMTLSSHSCAKSAHEWGTRKGNRRSFDCAARKERELLRSG